MAVELTRDGLLRDPHSAAAIRMGGQTGASSPHVEAKALEHRQVLHGRCIGSPKEENFIQEVLHIEAFC